MEFPPLFGLEELDKAEQERRPGAVTYTPTIYDQAPQHLLDMMAGYERISNVIRDDWGTIRLKNFIDHLMGDTRGHTREGFPPLASEGLLKLSIANIAYLESLGFNFVDPNQGTDFVGFNDTGWQIPKGF